MNSNEILLIGINSKYIHPSMGAFQLIANCDYSIPYKEFSIKDNALLFLDYIKMSKALVVCFSVYIWNVEIVKALIPKIDAKIILGGPEASFRISEFFKFKNVLGIIKGEGEESFNRLVHALINGSSFDEVPNLYYRKDNEILYTFSKLPDLKCIKHDYSLIKDYHNRICYLESSRGCYFNCSYCLASTEKPVRFFELDEIKTNLLFLLNNNARIVKFLDRSFNVNQHYMVEILSFINEHDNGFTTFQFEIVGDRLSNEAISLLNKMRYKSIRLEIGIQTTNPVTTEAILRKQDFNVIASNIKKIKDNVVIHTDLIAGLPYEDYNSFINSFNETFMLLTEELQLGFLKELKGTHISNTKEMHGYIFSDTAPYEVISNNYISHDELNEIKFVENAVDKIYNKNIYPRLMKYLFEELKLEPFKVFHAIGKNLSHTMLPAEISQMLLNVLKYFVVDKEYLFFLIKQDYLAKDKIKPKIWWDSSITREERNIVINQFVSLYPELNADLLFRYSKIEKYNNIYYLILYKPKKEYFMEFNYGFN